jgi:L-asparaginase II
MACGDLPSDAIAPLRTLLSVIKMVCATGPGLERDVRELIEAASMACVDLPPREARALRTLLRVASGKLGEAKTGIEAQNDGAAVVGLPGRSLGLDIECRRGAANARPPAA